MSDHYEVMSNGIKSFSWESLSPGEYKMIGDEFVRIGNEVSDTDLAAEKFLAVLRKLV
jgi:hypothetical protein